MRAGTKAAKTVLLKLFSDKGSRAVVELLESEWNTKEAAEIAFVVFRLRTINPDEHIEVTLTMLLEA